MKLFFLIILLSNKQTNQNFTSAKPQRKHILFEIFTFSLGVNCFILGLGVWKDIALLLPCHSSNDFPADVCTVVDA